MFLSVFERGQISAHEKKFKQQEGENGGQEGFYSGGAALAEWGVSGRFRQLIGREWGGRSLIGHWPG
jgi:hypothetical protein